MKFSERHEREKAKAEKPVEAARRKVRSRIEDAEEVKGRDDEEEVPGPVVDRADEAAERHLVLQGADRPPGTLGGRLVREEKERSARDQDEEEDERHPPEAERPLQSESLLGDQLGMEVKEEMGEASRLLRGGLGGSVRRSPR